MISYDYLFSLCNLFSSWTLEVNCRQFSGKRNNKFILSKSKAGCDFSTIGSYLMSLSIIIYSFLLSFFHLFSPILSAVLVVENKKVIVENHHGEKLVGILHETGSNELVIICHGFRSTKVYDLVTDSWMIILDIGIFQFSYISCVCVCVFCELQDRIPMVSLAFAFEKEGISAFRFDFAGNG